MCVTIWRQKPAIYSQNRYGRLAAGAQDSLFVLLMHLRSEVEGILSSGSCSSFSKSIRSLTYRFTCRGFMLEEMDWSHENNFIAGME